jgi:hypothetical protein
VENSRPRLSRNLLFFREQQTTDRLQAGGGCMHSLLSVVIGLLPNIFHAMHSLLQASLRRPRLSWNLLFSLLPIFYMNTQEKKT